jgi:exopolysaccharide biosynthesis protein
VPLLVVTVDLSDPNVRVTGEALASGHADRFDSMVRRTHPTAAITGTYFGMGSLVPVGDIVVNGALVHHGGVGTALCVTGDNRCEIIRPRRHSRSDWSAYDFVCCAGPRLVAAGHLALDPHTEGFRDPALFRHARRLAIGLTADNRLILAATRQPISLRRLAYAMRALGCMDAINLDAGSSLGFYYGGRFIVKPQRRLTNLILIYNDQDRFERFKARLAPALPRTALR